MHLPADIICAKSASLHLQKYKIFRRFANLFATNFIEQLLSTLKNHLAIYQSTIYKKTSPLDPLLIVHLISTLTNREERYGYPVETQWRYSGDAVEMQWRLFFAYLIEYERFIVI